jgi:hypothetical protein
MQPKRARREGQQEVGSNQATTNGSFGSVSYQGNTLSIDIAPGSLGNIWLTSADAQIQCFWDGTQWVCNSIASPSNT